MDGFFRKNGSTVEFSNPFMNKLSGFDDGDAFEQPTPALAAAEERMREKGGKGSGMRTAPPVSIPKSVLRGSPASSPAPPKGSKKQAERPASTEKKRTSAFGAIRRRLSWKKKPGAEATSPPGSAGTSAIPDASDLFGTGSSGAFGGGSSMPFPDAPEYEF